MAPSDRRPSLARDAILITAFLAPVGYAALLTACAAHEVVGHGLAALAVGGEFRGFSVHLSANGSARVAPPPGAPTWAAIVVDGAGIVVECVAGLVLCFVARRLRANTAGGLAAAVAGLTCFLDAVPYVLWGALDIRGRGDPARILQTLSDAGWPHVDGLRRTLMIVAAAAVVATGYWGIGSVFRRVEHVFRRAPDSPVGGRRREAALLVFVVIPAVAFIYLIDLSAVERDLGWFTRDAAAAALLASTCLVHRFPLRPFAEPLRLRRSHFVAAYSACTAAAAAILLWLGGEGVHW